jgi:type VI protein secretion system component VasK
VLVSCLIVGLVLRWFSADAVSILIVSSMILAVYAIIWLCMYIAWKWEMRKMNALTEAYQKERSETDT